jgi:hypothetical protein
MNASYSFAQAKSLVVDDLARQKTQDHRIISEQAEPKRQKFRQSRLMGWRRVEQGERQPYSPGRGHFR